jgi:hypothetical protein
MEDIMTHHTADSPLTIEFHPVKPLKLPMTGIGAVLSNLCTAAGKIFELAYVQPYKSGKFIEFSQEDSEEGRDPSW